MPTESLQAAWDAARPALSPAPPAGPDHDSGIRDGSHRGETDTCGMTRGALGRQA